MRRMLITLTFWLLLWNRGLLPVSHIQLLSRCAGAGRGHSQAASPGWPVEISHTVDIVLSLWMGVGRGGGSYHLLLFLWVQFLSCQEVWTFQGVGVFFFLEFCNVLKNLWVLGSVTAAWGLAANRSLGGEKIVLCKVYFAYSFLSLLLSLLLVVSGFPLLPYWTLFIATHKFPLLSVFLPHPAGGRKGRGERVAVLCLVVGCQVKPWQGYVVLNKCKMKEIHGRDAMRNGEDFGCNMKTNSMGD